MAGRSWIRGKLIGTGSFSRVNLAMDRKDGEIFAVKTVDVTDNEARAQVSLQAVENEIKLLQSLDSEYIVRYLGNDWSEERSTLMRNLFLEYMPEGNLAEFLKQFASAGSLDEHLIRTYTRSIVEGIDYLHRNGIVHCDIKGKNVLIGNGNVKLTDFGSAKRVGDVVGIESDSVDCSVKVNGTPLWMAPEVVRQAEQGTASDIWSLGCTVVEMATGRAPWSNLTNPFVALYHIGCTDELPAVPSSLSAEAHDFLSHCFQRDPQKRWTSAQLLQHPFLNSPHMTVSVNTIEDLSSPVTVIGFPASASHSLQMESFENSVPILNMPSFLAKGCGIERQGVSSLQSLGDQGNKTFGVGFPFSPCDGEWIVVRSPKGSSLTSQISDSMASTVKSSVSLPETSITGKGAVASFGRTALSANENLTPSLTSENMVGARPRINDSSVLPVAHADGKGRHLHYVGHHVLPQNVCQPRYLSSVEEQLVSLDLAASTMENRIFPRAMVDQEPSRNCEVARDFWVAKKKKIKYVRKRSIGGRLYKCAESHINQLHWYRIGIIDQQIPLLRCCTSYATKNQRLLPMKFGSKVSVR